jgi:hypothetical protein
LRFPVIDCVLGARGFCCFARGCWLGWASLSSVLKDSLSTITGPDSKVHNNSLKSSFFPNSAWVIYIFLPRPFSLNHFSMFHFSRVFHVSQPSLTRPLILTLNSWRYQKIKVAIEISLQS